MAAARNGQSTVLSIQYLRGAAAIGSAICHLAGHTAWHCRTGAAGVDIFFVISGFVMWLVTADARRGAGSFLLDRITRVAPPYLLLTWTVYLAATGVPGAFPNMHINLSHVVLSSLFLPHTDPYGTAFPVVIPGWTLTYEMFFYVIVAIGLATRQRSRLTWFALVFGALVLAGTLLLPGSPPLLDTYTNPLLLEFLAGLALGAAWQADLLPRAGWGAACACAGLALLVAWQYWSGSEPTDARVLIWGVPAMLIVGGAVTMEKHHRIPLSRAALLVGNASFSIYLVNVFVIAAAWRLAGAISVPMYLLFSLGGTILAGILFWHCVERPLTRAVRRLADRPARILQARAEVQPTILGA